MLRSAPKLHRPAFLHSGLLFSFILFSIAFHNCSSQKPPEGITACHQVEDKEQSDFVNALGLDPSLLKNKTGIYSLEDGTNSLVIRAWLCDKAKKTLDIQYYIFSKDNTGLIACDYLVRAADRGVKVRLIIDDATVKAGSREIHAIDSHENIEIKVYNPGVKLGKPGTRLKKWLTEPQKLHKRMHIKTLTVDDQSSIIGGRNIADEYYDFDEEYNFRDRDVWIIGKNVAEVKSSFEVYWNDSLCVPYSELVSKRTVKKADPHRFDKLHAYACDTANFSLTMREKIRNFPKEFKRIQEEKELTWHDQVSYVAEPPSKNEDNDQTGKTCIDSIVALLNEAKEYVDIQSPYLITTDEGKTLFRDLVKRGVKVRILTNSLGATDNFEAFSGYQRDREEFLKTGVEVYEFKPNAPVRFELMNKDAQAAMSYTPVYGLHSKTMIVDGKVLVIGSFNLDPRSVNLNSECIAIIRSPQAAAVVARYVNKEFLPENAWRITPEFNPDKEASFKKRTKVASRRIVPKDIL